VVGPGFESQLVLDLDNNHQSPDGYYSNDVADSWLKDDVKANEVVEPGYEFHSVIILSAKYFWN